MPLVWGKETILNAPQHLGTWTVRTTEYMKGQFNCLSELEKTTQTLSPVEFTPEVLAMAGDKTILFIKAD